MGTAFECGNVHSPIRSLPIRSNPIRSDPYPCLPSLSILCACDIAILPGHLARGSPMQHVATWDLLSTADDYHITINEQWFLRIV